MLRRLVGTKINVWITKQLECVVGIILRILTNFTPLATHITYVKAAEYIFNAENYLISLGKESTYKQRHKQKNSIYLEF